MKSYYLQRVAKLSGQLKQGQGFILSEPHDLFYLTGLVLSEGLAIVVREKALLIVDGRYIGTAKSASPIEVALLEEGILEKVVQGIDTLCFDEDKVSVAKLKTWQKQLPGITFEGTSSPVLRLRAQKDEGEITLLRDSAELLMKGLKHVVSKLKEGVSEKEMALEFELFCRRSGAKKLSFDPIIAFGEKGAYPHYHPTNNTLKKGDAVLLDMGVMLQGYASDMTRTFCFEGEFSPRMQLFYDVTTKAKQAALDLCRAGVKIADLDLAARAVMAEYDVESFYPHSLGHGVGLEVHELPRVRKRSEETLQEGMVITIEPGLYEPGIGGVRLEDTVVVTKTGHINFFESLSL